MSLPGDLDDPKVGPGHIHTGQEQRDIYIQEARDDWHRRYPESLYEWQFKATQVRPWLCETCNERIDLAQDIRPTSTNVFMRVDFGTKKRHVCKATQDETNSLV